MCGICAIAGTQGISKPLLTSLLRLEYRGYDSCGMMLFDGERCRVRKDVGDIHSVNGKVRFLEMKGCIGLAHTRWATHGGVTRTNSHPHLSNDGSFALVHNGILSNYLEVRNELAEKGFRFESETDSEVFANLLQHYCEEDPDEDLERCFVRCLKAFKGHYALAVFSVRNPGKIYAARYESPLVLGLGNECNVVASDVGAMMTVTKNMVILKDGEYCVMDRKEAVVKSISNRSVVVRKPEICEWDVEKAKKGGFRHFMIKEIFDQPFSIKSVLDLDGAVLDRVAGKCANAETTYLVGVGTTYYVAMTGAYLFSKLTNLDVRAVSSDEFGLLVKIRPQTHALFMSQSGETYDTRIAVKAAKRARAMTSAIVNVVGSSISQDVDDCIFQSSGPEVSVVSTKAAMAQMILLYRLAMRVAVAEGGMDEAKRNERERDIADFAATVNEQLNEKSGLIRRIASLTSRFHSWFFIGRGVYYPIALEASLKMKEVTYLHAEGIPAGFLKHGTLAMVDENLISFFFMPSAEDEKLYRESVFALEEVKARNGKTIGFADPGDAKCREFFDWLIPLPSVTPELCPFFELIMAQLLSYYSALHLKRNIDKPRNLAKSVTVG